MPPCNTIVLIMKATSDIQVAFLRRCYFSAALIFFLVGALYALVGFAGLSISTLQLAGALQDPTAANQPDEPLSPLDSGEFQNVDDYENVRPFPRPDESEGGVVPGPGPGMRFAGSLLVMAMGLPGLIAGVLVFRDRLSRKALPILRYCGWAMLIAHGFFALLALQGSSFGALILLTIAAGGVWIVLVSSNRHVRDLVLAGES